MSVKIPLVEIINYMINNKLILLEKDNTALNKSELVITGFTPINETCPGSLTWMKCQNLEWSKVNAAAVICHKDLVIPSDTDIVFIKTENPRYAFVKVLTEFYPFERKCGIELTAVIGDNCNIGNDVYIGHYSVIGDNVTIGDNTIIHSHVVIYHNCKIGSNCIINSGVVIGADGFGYEKDEQGRLIKFPHIGGVIVGNDVEVNSNTIIHRGVLSNTAIGNNVKISALCHIAHNVNIEENAAIASCCSISGSTKIGRNCWIAPGSVVRDVLTIGDDSFVGLGAVVVKNVEQGVTVAGVPAKPVRKKEL